MFTDGPKLSDPIPVTVFPETDVETYNHILEYNDMIIKLAKIFLADKQGMSVSVEHEHESYTNAPDYFKETMSFHSDPWVTSYLAIVMDFIRKINYPINTIVDTGCAFGISGLYMLLGGFPSVTFHDFKDTIGMQFLQWVKDNTDLGNKMNIVPYGDFIREHDLCLAIDVLEHIGSESTAIKWFKSLGNICCISYPCRVPYQEPYKKPTHLDRWVDDEAVQHLLQWRYFIRWSSLRYNWRTCIFS